MANINAALPTAIAVPFHPPTEALQHDNLIRPVIPKTEIIASYTKLREDEKQAPFFDQVRSIIQDENEQSRDSEQRQQQSMAEQRRLNLFAKRTTPEGDNESKALQIIKDFKLTLSIIEERYNQAVTPIADPCIDYLL